MAIVYGDVEEWLQFTCDATGVDEPTDAQVTADIAAAQSDFEAYTDATFVESNTKHLLLLKMLLDKMHYAWHKEQSANAEGYSTPAGSVNRSHQYVYYNKTRFDDLVNSIKGLKRTMRFLDNR